MLFGFVSLRNGRLRLTCCVKVKENKESLLAASKPRDLGPPIPKSAFTDFCSLTAKAFAYISVVIRLHVTSRIIYEQQQYTRNTKPQIFPSVPLVALSSPSSPAGRRESAFSSTAPEAQLAAIHAKTQHGSFPGRSHSDHSWDSPLGYSDSTLLNSVGKLALWILTAIERAGILK